MTHLQPKSIGFSGTRNGGMSFEQISTIIRILDSCGNYIIVNHGDCQGMDAEFHQLCIEYRNQHPDKKIVIRIFPPTIQTMRAHCDGDIMMSAQPYITRNKTILQYSSMLIACPKNKVQEELRSGTWSTIRQAKKLKIKTIIL